MKKKSTHSSDKNVEVETGDKNKGGLTKKKLNFDFIKKAIQNVNLSTKKSIGTKIFYSFIISVLLCVSLVGIVSYIISNNLVESKVTEASEQTIVQAGDKLDFVFNRYDSIFREMLANQTFFNNLAKLNTAEDDGSYEYGQLKNAVEDQLIDVGMSDDNIEMHLINVEKSSIFTTLPLIDEEMILQSSWYEDAVAAEQSSFWIGSQEAGVAGKSSFPTLSFGRVLNVDNNKYVLVIDLNQEYLVDVVGDVRFGEDGLVKLVDASNTIVYSPNLEELNTKNSFAIDASSESNVIKQDGEFIFQYESTVSDWYLVGAVSIKELTKDTRIIFYVTIAIIILSIIGSFFIGRSIAKMIGVPLGKISKLMAIAKEGDLSVRSDFSNRQDELGELAKSFDEMLEKIAEMMKKTKDSSNKVLDAAIQLTDISKVTAESAKEVSLASEEIASGASTLTQEAENGNNLALHINKEVDNVFNSNIEMEKYAKEVLDGSNTGINKMNELVEQTKHGEQMTSALISKTDTLKESTNQITNIMDILTKVSQQTNLLSLNAAIEAARAGEAGKGFAVVADEIRKLSAQSKESIDTVGKIVSSIVNEVNETLTMLETANPIFQEQVAKAQETDTILNNVGQHMDDFTKKIEMVSSSIKQLRDSQETLSETIAHVSATAQESSAISEEVSASTEEQIKVSDSLVTTSDELKVLSEELQAIINKFKI